MCTKGIRGRVSIDTLVGYPRLTCRSVLDRRSIEGIDRGYRSTLKRGCRFSTHEPLAVPLCEPFYRAVSFRSISGLYLTVKNL